MPRLKVHESSASFTQDVDDSLADHQSADRLISGSQAFGNRLEVRDDIFLLPSVQRAGAAHACEDLVEDEERTVLGADVLHGFEVAWDGGHST